MWDLTDSLVVSIATLYLVMSLVTFIAYGVDKYAAIKGYWRIKENTLQLLSLVGGWPGAFVAQRLLRHKCSKSSFKRIYYLSLIINLSILYMVISGHGVELIKVTIHEAAELYNLMLNTFK